MPAGHLSVHPLKAGSLLVKYAARSVGPASWPCMDTPVSAAVSQPVQHATLSLELASWLFRCVCRADCQPVQHAAWHVALSTDKRTAQQPCSSSAGSLTRQTQHPSEEAQRTLKGFSCCLNSTHGESETAGTSTCAAGFLQAHTSLVLGCKRIRQQASSPGI